MPSPLLKKLGILAGVLLVLLAVYLYRQVPRTQTPFAKAETQAEHVILSRGAAKIELRKDQKAWKVGSGGALEPADENQVKMLLSGLEDLQVEDEISARPDRVADFEVAEGSGTRVSVWSAQETKLGEGIFGKPAPDMAHAYFRYPDKPNVYLTRRFLRGELSSLDLNFWKKKN